MPTKGCERLCVCRLCVGIRESVGGMMFFIIYTCPTSEKEWRRGGGGVGEKKRERVRKDGEEEK